MSLESHLEGVVNVFHTYSVRVGDFDQLSKKELKQLIEKELPNYKKKPKDAEAMAALFKDLDQNRDEQVSFGEFMRFITTVLIATHEHIHEDGP
ncbi:protein S100-A12-like [Tachyglossus aculeatus]|uniref:protein S100-A12-like n=1 Tax=Tachyglossus aculeatus TaxID=9261 RepID=UPI0018F6D87A|nr:protein S100-A12-like [Tachyglossus aculeatus]